MNNMNSSNSKEGEETKKCSECFSDIPKKARKCVKCGSKQRTKMSKLVIIILVVGFVLPIAMASMVDDSSSTASDVPAIQKSNFELGTYKVASEDFAYMSSSEVNVWKSYSNRTKVGPVSEGEVVEVTLHDNTNDYCKIKTGSVTGWIACGWLVKTK
jgi:ribosomal protein L40E